MSIVRITRFKAREGVSSNLHDFLKSIVPLIEGAQGCTGCRILQSQEDQNEFICIEDWNTVSDHQTATKNIPPAKLMEAMALLAEPPAGTYYSL